MKRRPVLIAMTLLSVFVSGAWRPSAAADAVPALAYKDTRWVELVPMGWDPMKRFRAMNLDRLSDSSPQMLALMDEMRADLDNAPTLETMNGAAVRMPGYVVPLDLARDGLKEFLLVPYFGACVHTPPPPANQIIHVRLTKPAQGLKSMDAVWVSGVLKTERLPSEMGVSGYRMDAVLVVPYSAAPRK